MDDSTLMDEGSLREILISLGQQGSKGIAAFLSASKDLSELSKTETVKSTLRSLPIRKKEFEDFYLEDPSIFVIYSEEFAAIFYNQEHITSTNSWSKTNMFVNDALQFVTIDSDPTLLPNLVSTDAYFVHYFHGGPEYYDIEHYLNEEIIQFDLVTSREIIQKRPHSDKQYALKYIKSLLNVNYGLYLQSRDTIEGTLKFYFYLYGNYVALNIPFGKKLDHIIDFVVIPDELVNYIIDGYHFFYEDKEIYSDSISTYSDFIVMMNERIEYLYSRLLDRID